MCNPHICKNIHDIHNIIQSHVDLDKKCDSCSENYHCFWHIWYKNCILDDMFCEIEKMEEMKEGSDWEAIKQYYTPQESKDILTVDGVIKFIEQNHTVVVNVPIGDGFVTMRLNWNDFLKNLHLKKEGSNLILRDAGITILGTGK